LAATELRRLLAMIQKEDPGIEPDDVFSLLKRAEL
jgi:hypothetical protein